MKPTDRRTFLELITAGALGTALDGKLRTGGRQGEAPAPIERIAFGSCAQQDEPQPLWAPIIERRPDVFLFIGDNIYADTADMDVMRAKYDQLAANDGYQRLTRTCPVLATWDDHDYGQNDAGAEYAKKKESEAIFLDFFGVPEDSPRRKRPGIYGAHVFGPPGQRVQIILLDTRYFKAAAGRRRNRASAEAKKAQNIVGWYLPTDDPAAALLGEAQWAWLEEQLREEAELRIIASSVQVVAYEKGMECWGNYPHERERLFGLVEKTNAKGVLFVSGDVHFSEVSMTDAGPYPLYDFTSSGMTHSNSEWAQAVNTYRVGEAYTGRNAGLIQVDWNRRDPAIRLQTIGQEGRAVLRHTISLSDLR